MIQDSSAVSVVMKRNWMWILHPNNMEGISANIVEMPFFYRLEPHASGIVSWIAKVYETPVGVGLDETPQR